MPVVALYAAEPAGLGEPISLETQGAGSVVAAYDPVIVTKLEAGTVIVICPVAGNEISKLHILLRAGGFIDLDTS